MQTGRVIVITGAAGGMGSLFVDRFLANGDAVVATDIASDALEVLNPGAGTKLVTVAGDISKDADCQRVADAARDIAGRVDVLVNCAGYFPITPFEEMTSDEWRRVVDVNLTGHFLMTRAMLPLMKGRNWGRIINIGSASVFEGVPGQAPYVAAKAGLVGLSRCLAREFGGYGITVNVMTPGLTVTPPVRDGFPPDMLAKARDTRALKRDEQPGDLVGAVFFLASPAADFITGQIINVDGGNHMH
ncbi:MAG: SDR family oxidoreductase [Gemmatimonadaceae bacterium]|nr:SDR family oxidoreductase [Acetobacteraceae bacterium]